MLRILIVFVSCVSATTATLARDIYVSNVAGDDAMNGANPAAVGSGVGPVRTVAKALRLAIASDHIILQDTGFPYRENFTLTGESHSGQFLMPFVIEGNGAELDGSAPVPTEAWEHVGGEVFRFNPPRKAYQQLFIDGRPVVRKPTIGEEELVPELGPREWCLSNGSIYFRVERGMLPQMYAMSYAADRVGITLYKVHDVVIHNLTVQGFQLDGINAHDGVRMARLLEVTCRGNGRSGVCVTGGSRVELAGSTLGANGAAQLWLNGYSRTELINCQLLPQSAPEMVRRGGELWTDGNLQEAVE